MKIYKDIYWSIISPANLFRAWELFKSDKRNKPDVAEFERDLEQNIFKLYRDLKEKSYKHGGYEGFWIRDPKMRRIHKATVRDRVLHHAIFSVINPIFEPTFIPASFSCRIGKGTHKGVEAVAAMLNQVSRNNTKPCYALKCDVRKFFDSVDHGTLLDMLCERIKDPDAVWLLREIVESYATAHINLFESRGIPIGNLTSQVFANIYMNEFDQFIKHKLKVRHYARYTDDFVMVANDPDYLRGLLEPIQEFLTQNLRLELHPRKIILRPYNQGIDFLGYVIFPGHILLRNKTRNRMFRKMRERVMLYRGGAIKEETMLGALRSYMGVLSHADTKKLGEKFESQFWYWLKG